MWVWVWVWVWVCVRVSKVREGKPSLLLASSFQTQLLHLFLHLPLYFCRVFNSHCLHFFYVQSSMVCEGRGDWQVLAQSSVNPSLYILYLFCHTLVSKDSLLNTHRFISEIITAFEGELYKVVRIVLSSKNLNYEIRLKMLAQFSLEK